MAHDLPAPRALRSVAESLPPLVSPAVSPSPHRRRKEGGRLPLLHELPQVTCMVRGRIPTTGGSDVWIHLYRNSLDEKEHLALVFGDRIHSHSLFAPRPGETERDRIIRGAYTGTLYPGRVLSTSPPLGKEAAPVEPPLVRIHSECYTGETTWSRRCDCGEQLDEAARIMSQPESGGGCIVYLRQEGRGIGLGEKLKAYNLQDLGSDTVEANLLLRHPADARSYGIATSILMDLGLREIRLLTNNPDKMAAVEGAGQEVRVVERVPMVPQAWKTTSGQAERPELAAYLRTKVDKMGHLM